jgi:TPR repeat protein
LCYSKTVNVAQQGIKLFDQREYKKALSIFTECAKAGNARAMNAVGYVHEHGSINGKRNIEKAVEWYTKAAETGYPAAHYNLGKKYFSDKDLEP